MNRHPHHFRLSARGLLVAAISAAFAHTSFANSGRVDFTAGNVTVTGTDGSTRQLARGTQVKSGDRIVSDAGGRAQIRFSDGAFVALQPNTDFNINNYAYDGQADGKERAFFGLLKGAMRTVTGVIGRSNKSSYQISTPSATIGIRGTGGVITVAPDGSTLVLGTSGVWTLTNPAGSVDVPAGTAAATTSNPNQPPQQTTQGPTVPAPQAAPSQKLEEKFSESENRTSDGTQSVVASSAFKPLVTGPGYAIAGAEGGSYFSQASTNATFSSSGMMMGFNNNGSDVTLAGTHAEFQTADGVLAWGRWIGQVNDSGCCLGRTHGTNQGLHYVVGLPTATASLPTTDFTYNLLGATSPTTADGSVAPGTLSLATLTGNFSSSQVSVEFAGTIGPKSFSAVTNGMTLNTGTATFSGGGSYTGSLAGTYAGSSVTGFFAGAGASHAGISYTLFGTTLGSNVIGAAAFRKGAPATMYLLDE